MGGVRSRLDHLIWRSGACGKMACGPENPFKELKISSWEPLRTAARAPCPRCRCSRKVYCYTCYELVVGVDPGSIPRVRLPVKVDILKHPAERAGKSTASHARILAPDSVNIHIFPDIPHYPDPTRVALVYPKEDAVSVGELASRLKQRAAGDGPEVWWGALDRVVFIDSTWQQTHVFLRDERVRALPSVRLTEAETYFWRPQRKASTHLATIEAVYYFFREMETSLTDSSYDGQYDDLLYFYAYQYDVVQQAQRERVELTGEERTSQS